MFKVGDKIAYWQDGKISTIINYSLSKDTFAIKNSDGTIINISPEQLNTTYTKVDSDADSSGLYGVDDSAVDYSGPVTFDPFTIPNHAPYKIDPVYTIPKSGNYYFNNKGIFGAIEGDKYEIRMADPFVKDVKCDCGALKTYGESCNPEFHSSWCDMGKK